MTKDAPHYGRNIALTVVVCAIPIATLVLLGELFTNITHKYGPDAIVSSTNCGSLMNRGGCWASFYQGREAGAWITATVLFILVLIALTLGTVAAITTVRPRRSDWPATVSGSSQSKM